MVSSSQFPSKPGAGGREAAGCQDQTLNINIHLLEEGPELSFLHSLRCLCSECTSPELVSVCFWPLQGHLALMGAGRAFLLERGRSFRKLTSQAGRICLFHVGLKSIRHLLYEELYLYRIRVSKSHAHSCGQLLSPIIPVVPVLCKVFTTDVIVLYASRRYLLLGSCLLLKRPTFLCNFALFCDSLSPDY